MVIAFGYELFRIADFSCGYKNQKSGIIILAAKKG
jgi:hypothetical protein